MPASAEARGGPGVFRAVAGGTNRLYAPQRNRGLRPGARSLRSGLAAAVRASRGEESSFSIVSHTRRHRPRAPRGVTVRGWQAEQRDIVNLGFPEPRRVRTRTPQGARLRLPARAGPPLAESRAVVRRAEEGGERLVEGAGRRAHHSHRLVDGVPHRCSTRLDLEGDAVVCVEASTRARSHYPPPRRRRGARGRLWRRTTRERAFGHPSTRSRKRSQKRA